MSQACILRFGFTLNFIQVAYVVNNGKKKKKQRFERNISLFKQIH